MSLAVASDRSVLHTARDGTVRLTDAAGNTKVAGKLDVYTHDEEGLQGIAANRGPGGQVESDRITGLAPTGSQASGAGPPQRQPPGRDLLRHRLMPDRGLLA